MLSVSVYCYYCAMTKMSLSFRSLEAQLKKSMLKFGGCFLWRQFLFHVKARAHNGNPPTLLLSPLMRNPKNLPPKWARVGPLWIYFSPHDKPQNKVDSERSFLSLYSLLHIAWKRDSYKSLLRYTLQIL